MPFNLPCCQNVVKIKQIFVGVYFTNYKHIFLTVEDDPVIHRPLFVLDSDMLQIGTALRVVNN